MIEEHEEVVGRGVDSDVWMTHYGARAYVCWKCTRHDGRHFELTSTDQALGHLLAHREGKDRVPESALEKLRTVIVSGHSYDESSFELANGFLSEYPTAGLFDRACLAQCVQDAVEAWLTEHGFA